jgi:putative hydrolase of the HAD superfamily
VVFDLGGEDHRESDDAFTAYEAEAGLPEGLIVRLHSTDPDTNAWARYEAANDLDAGGFADGLEAEAPAGCRPPAGRPAGVAALAGEVRPAIGRGCAAAAGGGLPPPLALLSNNVAPMERTGRLGELLGLVRRWWSSRRSRACASPSRRSTAAR